MKSLFQFTLLVLAVLVLTLTPVLSQTTNKPPDRMKMLAAFNGSWYGEMVKNTDNKTLLN